MPRRAALSVAVLLLSLLTPAPGRTAPPDAAWTTFDGVSIPVPPAEHPRLYLRARDIPDLERRTTNPVLKPYWDRLQEAAKNRPATAVEVDALRYLLTRDADLGQRTAAAALKLLEDAKFSVRKRDVARPIGRLMVTGAIVYDWCYPVLTADQKKGYVEQLLKLARSLECGYPPPKTHAVTGHYSEWMLMRDMLSAGVAIYDEFPEMYQLAANRFFGVFRPVRNWLYQGHAFHQGSAYGLFRNGCEMFPLWIFDRMGAGPVYDPALQFVPYQWIYMRRPDGQLLRAGDHYAGSAPQKMASLLNASFYKDPYVLADALSDPSSVDPLFTFLWRDPDLKPRPVSELPLSRYMGLPYGWMIARTGWDAKSVIAEMKINAYNFNNHQHLDAGAFQIYCQGPLAIDSGLYDGDAGGYGGKHDINYSKRTIAHNCLLVYDPAEKFAFYNSPVANDGGQKFPNSAREPGSLDDMLANYRTADVLGEGFGPDTQQPAYTYLKGDLTRAYGSKVKSVQRSFVFLNLAKSPVPAALIVFDRAVAAKPEFKKYWLLHSMEKPQIDGARITVAPEQRGWRGKLVDEVLLPAQAEITPVGGPGKEFWVFGENFPNKPRGSNLKEFEPGEWRVEVSPRAAAEADHFLNVMQVMDREASPLAVKRIDDGRLIGALLGDTTIFFQRDGRRTDQAVTLRSQGARFLVTDLAEGTWRVSRDGAALDPPLQVSAESGTLWFEGPPGSYTLQR